MTRRVVFSYLAVAVFVLAILEIPLGVRYAQDAEFRLSVALERDAVVVADLVNDALRDGAVQVSPNLGTYADSGARIVIVNADGASVYDSENPSATGLGRDFASRQEISDALNGIRSQGTRYSRILDQELQYVAVPVASGGVIHGAVRITYPTDALQAQIRRTWLFFGLTALAVLAAVIPVGIAVARWVTRPTTALTRHVGRFAAGALDARADATLGPPEVRELARGFNQMADRLGTLLQDQRAFAADASHQLRSPLTALRLELEQLPDMDETERRDAVQRAITEIARLTDIVTSLLTLARYDGIETVSSVTVDVGDVITDRLSAWRPAANQRAVRLIEATPGVSVAVTSGSGFLEQILDVVLENAIAASPSGSAITVRITPTDSAYTTVEITDEGSGLDADTCELAFERFWRGAERPQGTGSGLGLPIARRLARLAGGDITLTPNDGPGVTATITVKRAHEPA